MARKLKRIRKNGEPYTRPAGIEQSIDAALAQDEETLIRRAGIRDRANPEYMPSECLLHLFREARLAGNKGRVNRLLEFLLGRCERLLKASIPDRGWPNAASLREDVLSAFCELLARVGSNQDATVLDFFEVRFNRALWALRKHRLAKLDRDGEVFEDVAGTTDQDGEPLDDENVLARLSKAARTAPSQEAFIRLREFMEALRGLPADEREAYMLVRIKGYDVESDNKDKTTAATLCKVSGRTIRKRLEKADEKLKKFKEEK